jgi:hypothetical protein
MVAMRFWGWAFALRVLKHLLPVKQLVRIVRPRVSPRRRADRELPIIRFMDARGRFPWRPPANCLERSLAGYRFLTGVGARPELVVGVRKVPDGRGIDGHVWLVLHGMAIGESDRFIEQFTPVLRFDADGHAQVLGSAAHDARAVRLSSATR